MNVEYNTGGWSWLMNYTAYSFCFVNKNGGVCLIKNGDTTAQQPPILMLSQRANIDTSVPRAAPGLAIAAGVRHMFVAVEADAAVDALGAWQRSKHR